MRRIGAVLLLATAGAACTALGLGPTPEITSHPADFAVEYQWQEGSLPPPYHYEYVIRLGPGAQGEIEYTPDYAYRNPPVWTETFDVSDDDLTALYKLMAARGVFERDWREQDPPPVGGGYVTLAVTASGQRVDIPGFLEPPDDQAVGEVHAAIEALVPEAIWNKLRAQHEEYKQAHPEG